MVALAVILGLLLVCSLVANYTMYKYIRGYFVVLVSKAETLEFLQDSLKRYHASLEDVYELKEFYGDPEIEDLIERTVDVRNNIEFYSEIIDLIDGDEEREDLISKYFYEEGEQEEDEWEEGVFYPGASGGNSRVLFDKRSTEEG